MEKLQNAQKYFSDILSLPK